MENHPAYPLMVALGRHKIKRYRRDLIYHDKRILQNLTTMPFVWYLYPQGTHIIFKTGRMGIDRHANEVYQLVRTINVNYPDGRWYGWDGRFFQAIDRYSVASWLVLGCWESFD